MRVAVVGHVEWVDFVRVERLPAPGEIVHAVEAWAEPAGGGGVAAVVLAALAGECTLFTALGDDELGRRSAAELSGHGVRVEAAIRPEPQRRAVTHVDDTGERTITLLSHKLIPRKDDPLPWAELAGYDAIYFTGGDPAALRAARVARSLVATARELPTLVEAGRAAGRARPLGPRSRRDLRGGLARPAAAHRRRDGRAPRAASSPRAGEVRRYAAAQLPGPVIRHVRRGRLLRRRAHIWARSWACPSRRRSSSPPAAPPSPSPAAEPTAGRCTPGGV